MEINTIVNANAYLGTGTDLAGKLAKIELPTLKAKLEDHGTIGIVGTPKIWAGWEPLEAKVEWSSFYPDAFKHRLNPLTAVELQVRGNLETYTDGGRTDEEAAVAIMSVRFSEVALGMFEGRKPVSGMEDTLLVEKIELKTGNTSHLKYDMYRNIYEVAGVDLLANMRTNLGASS